MTSFSTIAELYRSGGWCMHPDSSVRNLHPGADVRAFLGHLSRVVLEFLPLQERPLEARASRRIHASGGPVQEGQVTGRSQVAQAILISGGRTEEELLNAADAESTAVLPPITRRLNYFSLLANVSTLLGLLGTIFGLILAFSAVGAADPSQRSSFLAKGISEAMNATAFGLMMAVPALLVHGFLLSKAERILERVEEISISSRAPWLRATRRSSCGARACAPPVITASPAVRTCRPALSFGCIGRTSRVSCRTIRNRLSRNY